MTTRKDSRRNRDALLSAAREAFFTRGLDAPAKTIASAAGVGSATLYRHFPTRADLVTAVFGEEVQQCRNQLAAVLTTEDPWDSLRILLTTVADTEHATPGLAGTMLQQGAGIAPYTDFWNETGRVLTLIARRLRDDGSARPDISADDIWLILVAIRSVTAAGRGLDPQATARFIEIAIRGLEDRQPQPQA